MRILDVRQLGYLDGFALNYFFRAIYDNLLLNSQHDDELVGEELFIKNQKI